jgi:hypothetical protein
MVPAAYLFPRAPFQFADPFLRFQEGLVTSVSSRAAATTKTLGESPENLLVGTVLP